MVILTNFLAFIWVLSLPFFHFSLVGSLSVDNLLAPILLASIILRGITDSQSLTTRQVDNIVKVFLLMVLYFFTHTIGLVFTQTAVWATAYGVATSMLYFIIPVLYVRTRADVHRCTNALIVGFFVASLSALLAAIGLFEFEFSRQAESRIGVDALQKSIGVISSYGDVGIMLSLSVILAVSLRNERVLFSKGSYFKILIVVSFALIAIASMQSRNMILTLFTALFCYWQIGRWIKANKTNWAKKLYFSIFFMVTITAAIVVLFSEPLIEFIGGVGGTREASGTVNDRLSQYSYMLALLNDNFLFGVDPATYEQYAHEISLIHNLWLKEMVQGGILAIVAMLAIWTRALITQVNNYRRGAMLGESRAFIAILLSILVATQFYPGGTLIFWVILGVCSVVPAGEIKNNKGQHEATPVSRMNNRILHKR